MQYAAHLPTLPSTRSILVPLLALVVGAGVATGTYALIDNADEGVQSSRVIVVDRPAQPGEGVAAKHEAATAAAIAARPQIGEGVAAKNEAGTASAIAVSPQISAGVAAKNEAGTASAIGSGIELRGSKAADSQAEIERRTDLYGANSSLRTP